MALNPGAEEWFPMPKPIDVKNPKVRALYNKRLLVGEDQYTSLTPKKSIVFVYFRNPPQWFAGVYMGLTPHDAAGNRDVQIKLLDTKKMMRVATQDPYRNTEVYLAELPPVTDAQRIAQVVRYGNLPAGVEIELAEMLTGKRPKSFLPGKKGSSRSKTAKGRKYRKRADRPSTRRARSSSSHSPSPHGTGQTRQ